jgi:hypothetical protein
VTLDERELGGSFEVGIGGGLLPFSGKLVVNASRRWQKRGEELVSFILEAVSEEQLEAAFVAREDVDVLFAQAVNAAANSALASRRLLLARLVQQAVLDEAKVDESVLIVRALTRVDAPHVRCLEAIRRAEENAAAIGELEAVAPGAEQPSNRLVQDAVDQYGGPVLHALVAEGLVAGEVTWDGTSRITGTTVFGQAILGDLRAAGGAEA